MRVTAEKETVPPALNSLPCELLAYIFNLACPPIDALERSLCESKLFFFDKKNYQHSYMPLAISAVCRHWREVTLSSPELWSTLVIKTPHWNVESQVPLLRLYLTNTGPLPFSLDIDLRLRCPRVPVSNGVFFHVPVERKEIQPLTDVIFHEFSEKIQTLRLAGVLPEWMWFLSEQRLPKLRNLSFAWGEFVYPAATVTLKEGAFPLHPWESIRATGAVSTLQSAPALPPLTILHLRKVSVDICVEILLLCPHLIEYSCYDPIISPMDFTIAGRRSCVSEPFSLPNLRCFGWTPYIGGGYNNALLRNISLPNLEELHWSGESPYRRIAGEAAIVNRFFSSLPRTIHSLTFRGCFEDFTDDSYYSRLLSNFPHTQSLVFNRCEGPYLCSIFRLLSNRTPGMESFLLPQLRKVTVRKYAGGGDFGTALAKMLEMRRSVLQISNFTFEAVRSEFVWTDNAREGLRELQDQFPLTILEESQEKIFAYFTGQELALFS